MHYRNDMRITFVRAMILGLAPCILLANELPPPKGWTLTKKPSLLIYDSIHPRTNRGLRIEMKDAEEPQGDLHSYLRSHLSSMGYPEEATRACRPRTRRSGREVSCSTNTTEGAHTFYALRTKDGQSRFVHVLAVPNLSVLLAQFTNTKRILDAAENNVGRAGSTSTKTTLAEAETSSSNANSLDSASPIGNAPSSAGWGDEPV